MVKIVFVAEFGLDYNVHSGVASKTFSQNLTKRFFHLKFCKILFYIGNIEVLMFTQHVCKGR